jgi:NitT/TauT family transport system substrate-binding protein
MQKAFEKEKTMKKITRAIATVLGGLLLCFPILGCNKNNDKKVIRLSEVTHSIFYAPLYVAMNNGYFGDYGITVKLSNSGGSNNVMTAIASKSADIGLMGPEATV